ncbi:hypothetical protein H2198_003910 [Neophaeococcomyces mojaviensis]|uniref:Uncharacterized protein n=1 Tax=Neophaeococcomyces mojaviensis TaxID=3383035 RepID=A0ACC3AA09_9EURO|nr:hypothetical protein H2198_003910 [Knufia sp. JES_112]
MVHIQNTASCIHFLSKVGEFFQSDVAELTYTVPKEHNDSFNAQQSRQNHERPTSNQSVTHDHARDAYEVNGLAVDANSHDAISGSYLNCGETTVTSLSPLSQVFYPNGDRRKRRKISLEAEEAGQEQVEAKDASKETLETEDPVWEQQHSEVLPQAIQNEAKLNIDSTLVTSSTPRTRRGRPPKSLAIQQQRTLNSKEVLGTSVVKDAEVATTTTATKPKRAQRKKTIHINADGKLFQTDLPEKEVLSLQSSNTTATKHAHSGTKVTLKNGKFTQTLIVILKYTPGSLAPNSTGARLQSILSQPTKPRTQAKTIESLSTATIQAQNVTKITHPFFLGKAGQKPPSGLSNAFGIDSQVEATGEDGVQIVSESKRPVPWSDIVFKSDKPFLAKGLHLEKPAWPPLAYQHTGAIERLTAQLPAVPAQRAKKAKARQIQIDHEENVLNAFGTRLMQQSDANSDVFLPQRLHLPSHDVLGGLHWGQNNVSDTPIIATARQRALQARSAFDRAEAAGPLSWPQQYSPSTWELVLQPSCNVLYDWLKGLAVHNVKQGLDITHPKRVSKRRRRQKKKENEFDDFIVSDDEQAEAKKVKNAILIVGPNGCGKTAAVYAVAKQLGFEVFEIHSGMRRSQKDIFDKVGDMAQNHMVQGGHSLSRDSSVLPDIDSEPDQEDLAQPPVTNFFAQPTKKILANTIRPTTPQPSKQEQKQSLILFEEVDNIFEDDRGFWSGVQSLIHSSKRPVVLTCNDLQNIPLNELDLYEILTFEAPPPDMVVQYVTYVAAAEGHLLEPDTVRALYMNKGNDLRATMTELDFWCQMTVGSQKGGLDWYPSATNIDKLETPEQRPRVFSKKTFQDGLDLLPTILSDLEDGLRYADDCLELPPDLFFSPSNTFSSVLSRLEALSLLELQSDGEVIDTAAKLLLYTKMCQMKNGSSQRVDRTQVQHAMIEKERTMIQATINFECLSPLASEGPVFPPTQGRLAPTLDYPRSTLATDVAPYARSIVAFDQRLEQARGELFSSHGKKTRTTRAARAAAEGGDKADTRREWWFPKELDLQAVLATGNNWPQWHEGQAALEDLASTPASSTESAMVT